MIYRSSGQGCPSCGEPLGKVESGTHLLGRCRACGGVWVEEDTLRAIWAEVGGDGAPALASSAAARPRACFYCQGELEPRALHGAPVGRCAAHGLWFDFDELLAAVGRADAPVRGWLSALASVLDAGASYLLPPPAGGCLGCGRRLSRIAGPGGSFLRCSACGSAFVGHEVLRTMWSAMSLTAPLAIVARPAGRIRRCAICARPMLPASLHRVPIDECPMHGAWFDADELATALAAAAMPEKEWLSLFSDALARMS